MRRSLHLYAVKRSTVHDHAKKLCFDLEYEPESIELEAKFDSLEDIKKYLWLDNCKEDWCARCCMFAIGLSTCVSNQDWVTFSHSYSNPIWNSKWHFYNMYPGSSHTDFVNRFDQQHLYAEISINDVEYVQRQIANYGIAHRSVDKEALQETAIFIDFCQKWLHEQDVLVIYESEH